MDLEENKILVRHYINELVNHGDLEAAEQYISSPEALQYMVESVTWLRSIFPDLNVEIEDQIAEGDKVASRLYFSGTHLGVYKNLRPTGRSLSWQGIAMDQIADGKVVKMWHETDLLSMMKQLGTI